MSISTSILSTALCSRSLSVTDGALNRLSFDTTAPGTDDESGSPDAEHAPVADGIPHGDRFAPREARARNLRMEHPSIPAVEQGTALVRTATAPVDRSTAPCGIAGVRSNTPKQ